MRVLLANQNWGNIFEGYYPPRPNTLLDLLNFLHILLTSFINCEVSYRIVSAGPFVIFYLSFVLHLTIKNTVIIRTEAPNLELAPILKAEKANKRPPPPLPPPNQTQISAHHIKCTWTFTHCWCSQSSYVNLTPRGKT